MSLDIHRSGCPIQRTGKCLCDYLAQWDDRAEKDALAAFTKQMEAEGRVITIDTLAGRTSEWDGVFKQPGGLTGPGVMIIPDDLWDDFDPAKVLPGSPEFISSSEYQARQQEQGPTPFQSHLTDVEENPMPAEPRLQLPIVIATTAEDPAVIAEKIIKDNPQWFGELPAGTYQKREEDTEQLRLNTERSLTFWKGQSKHWQQGYWIMAGLAVAGWALSLARGIWGF